ncbi:MAG TPA: hypothetical protein VLA49_16430 [Anaerolineales bacterium]|nr:hypothetical protein [Anaerolineales bacterium]
MLIIICINLVVGSLLVVDYGESWDEQLRYRYATKSLAAYMGEIKSLGDEKGPFYVVLAKLGSDILLRFHPNWLPIEGWHFMHFLAFQVGTFFLYLFCIRFLDIWSSIGAVLLFGTQPLLWGHAFINPKDIPFMSFFLGSMALGLRMIDSLTGKYSSSSDQKNQAVMKLGDLYRLSSQDWKSARFKIRFVSLGLIGLLFASLLLLVVLDDYIGWTITTLVHQAYEAGSSSLLGRAFVRIAEQASDLPVESYIQKSLKLYPRLVAGYAVVVLCLGIWITRRLFPSVVERLFKSVVVPFPRRLKASLMKPSVWGAGIFLGLTASIRVVGPAAGVLITGLLVYCLGRKSLPVLVAYLSIAAVVLYATWPVLWGSPVERFTESFTKAADFPWDGKVMFGGIDYGVGELPPSYLPVLFSLQFTEPTLILFVFGLLVAAYKFARKMIDRGLVVVLGAWFFIPIMFAVVQRSTIYDNFRHFLFVTPPMFILAGLGIQSLLSKVRNSVLAFFIISVIVAPNLYWLVTLHPYQYVYYNSLTGGVAGAFRKYEMDYWATSYREAIEYVNEVAPNGSEVMVWGPDHIVSNYARQDLFIKEYSRGNLQDARTASYAIISTRHNKDQSLFPESESLFWVGRGGGFFAVVKQIDQAQPSE